MPKARYRTVQEYMEKTGTNHTRLLKRVEDETGRRISPQLFSMMLKGSRRCSHLNAFALFAVTGVPIEELRRWPRYAIPENSRSVA